MLDQLATAGQDRIGLSAFPPIPHLWSQIADQKGFDLIRRIKDRYHLELCCRHCMSTFVCKAFVLRTAKPSCPACQMARWRSDAEQAGVEFLSRDPADRHRADYRLGCGHRVSRQMIQIRRFAEGKTGLGCDACLRDRHDAAARSRGWTLVGPDIARGTDYRRYRHSCEHEQSVAVVNMDTGRFGCASCGQGWTATQSFIYLLDLSDPQGRARIKLGYSRDPLCRMRHQLGLAKSARVRLARSVSIATGHDAVRIEKAMHAKLRRRFPDAVVAREELSGWINVTSEIYQPKILPQIIDLLDRAEANACAN